MVEVKLWAGLRPLADNQSVVRVEARTIRELLRKLEERYPGLAGPIRGEVAVAVERNPGGDQRAGVPPEIASFQARSAFSGAGFTTAEAENVINHPTRRKIIATTMFVGSIGTPTLIVTVLVGFLASGAGSTAERTLIVVAGLLLLALAIANKPAERLLTRLGERYAQRRLLPALEGEVDELLVLDGDFVVASRRVGHDPKQAQRSLRGLDEAFRGCTVRGVRQADRFVGEPPADIDLRAGDSIIVYGRRALIAEPPT